MPVTVLSMQVQARPGVCYGSCTDFCCAVMQVHVRCAMGFSCPGEWYCSHSQRPSVADKGMLYPKFADKLALILIKTELNGGELYERTMTVCALKS